MTEFFTAEIINHAIFDLKDLQDKTLLMSVSEYVRFGIKTTNLYGYDKESGKMYVICSKEEKV